MLQIKNFLRFFAVLCFSLSCVLFFSEAWALGVGELCSSDSACNSNKCLAGVCMPGFPIDEDIGGAGAGVSFNFRHLNCSGFFQLEAAKDSAKAQEYFNQNYPDVFWQEWKTFCDVKVYSVKGANSKYPNEFDYKAIKGNMYYEVKTDKCSSQVAEIFEYLFCSQSAPPPPPPPPPSNQELNLGFELSSDTISGEVGELKKIQIKLFIADEFSKARDKVKIKITPEDSNIAKVLPNVANNTWNVGQVKASQPRVLHFLVELKRIGYTNIGIEIEGENVKRIYKNLPVWVSALPPSLLFTMNPSGMIMEKGETKEVSFTLTNQGQGKAYKPQISVENTSGIALIIDKSLPIYLNTILPGKSLTQKLKIKALTKGEVKFNFNLRYGLEPANSYEQTDHDFEESYPVQVAVTEKKKTCKDNVCEEKVKCLIEVSNIMGCALEVADVIPYLDKPVAAVLVTSDVCEIAKRSFKLDPIGSAVSGYLMGIDLADNVLDAVPVAGNITSAAIDAVEGSVDCLEGFIYDTVDKNCAGEKSVVGGYTGCFLQIAQTTADLTSKAKKTAGAVASAIYGMFGSPVYFRIVDGEGKELGPSDGVLAIQRAEFKSFFIKNPENLTGGYNVQVIGQENGVYDLHLALIGEGKVLAQKILTNQNIDKGEAQDIVLEVSEKSGNISGFQVKGEDIELTGKKGIMNFIKRYSWWLFGGLALAVVFVISYLKKKKNV